MRKAILVLAVLSGAAASAQAVGGGEYGPALRRMVTEAATGRCPAELMAEPLLSACRDQMPQMRPALAALGAVEDVAFVKAETHDDAGKGARVETYAVKYAGGKTTLWSIGNRKDGKFTTAYTLGQ